MTAWFLGVPLVIFAYAFAVLVWLDCQERIKAYLEEELDRIREILESIGRLP